MKKALFLYFLISTAKVFGATEGILENSPYMGIKVTVESETTLMMCEASPSLDVSIVKAKFQGSPARLFVKRNNYQSFTIPYYGALTFKHNLGDKGAVYQSKSFTLYQQSFSMGEKTRLVSNTQPSLSTTCESTWE